MSEFAEIIRNRTKIFSISVIKFCKTFPNNHIYWDISRQLLRSSTSVAANYRAACRARSDREFYAKLCIVVEEIDETLLWLEIIQEAELANVDEGIFNEAKELLAILAKSKKTVGSKLKNK